MCGVSAAAVTKACGRALLPACYGRQIDLQHPAARKYLSDKTAPSPEPAATGLDPLYEQAIDACSAAGTWSATFIQRTLHVGYVRACNIRDSLIANKIIAAPPKTVHLPPDLPPRPHRRGKGAARDRKKREAEPGDQIEIPDDIQALAHLPLIELIARYGTDVRFVDWLNAVQKIEAIHEKRLKNAENEGALVSRELVRTAVIDRIDGVFVRMLTDGAKTIATRAQTMAKAGVDLAEIRAMVEDQLGSFIRPAKTKMREALADHEAD